MYRERPATSSSALRRQLALMWGWPICATNGESVRGRKVRDPSAGAFCWWSPAGSARGDPARVVGEGVAILADERGEAAPDVRQLIGPRPAYGTSGVPVVGRIHATGVLAHPIIASRVRTFVHHPHAAPFASFHRRLTPVPEKRFVRQSQVYLSMRRGRPSGG
jgi:hypothetical protein